MKKRSLIVIIGLLFLGMSNVKATTDNYEIKSIIEDEGTVKATVKVSAYNNGELLKSTDDIKYYVGFIPDSVIAEEEEELKQEGSTLSEYLDSILNYTDSMDEFNLSIMKMIDNDGSIFISNDWYLSKDNNNATLIKCDLESQKCTVLSPLTTVVKPELPVLGKRYQIDLFGANDSDKINELTPFALYPVDSESGNNILRIKVGIIKNNDIIQKFVNNDSDALTSLLNYAKNDSDGKSWEVEESETLQLNNFKVSNGSYYYIYTEPTRDNSIYRNLEDIAIVMAKDDMLINDIEFKEIEEKNPENPKTGLNNYYLIGGLVLITSGIGYILVRNKKKFVK